MRCLQLTHVIAIEPTNIMLTQALGNKFDFFMKSAGEVCKFCLQSICKQTTKYYHFNLSASNVVIDDVKMI